MGDCGPHILHEPVNVEAAEEARKLQLETCGVGFDGETDGTRCESGVCVRVPNAGECCGCAPDGWGEQDGGEEDAGG